ncbi:MAG TPA: AAA family ATPase [Chloroflexia bacterium]|nr:AAA family ATPase [Chloroflexia bacterium]
MTHPDLFLVIVSGPPASGKTFLGKRIAQKFQVPFLNKDGIKEILFDDLSWSDAAWSRKLNTASIDLLYHFTEALLIAGRSFVVESNFKPEVDTDRFSKVKQKYPFYPIQVQCVADGNVLLERFKTRQRHPGHADQEIQDYLTPVLLKGRHDRLEIGGDLIEVDTTKFEDIDFPKLFQTLGEIIGNISPEIREQQDKTEF